MLVPFDQMPETSRIWIYQSERKLNQDEIDFIEKVSIGFLNEWAAHGNALKASFVLQHNQFLILTVDEDFSQASGCSIDSSVHLIKAIEEELNISLTNNGNIAFLIDDQVVILPFNALRGRVKEKEILPDTKVFDNTIQNLGDFHSKWLTESNKTWVNRFFN